MELARSSRVSCCRLAAAGRGVGSRRAGRAGGRAGQEGQGTRCAVACFGPAPLASVAGSGMLGTTSSAPALCFPSVSPQLTRLHLAPVKYFYIWGLDLNESIK